MIHTCPTCGHRLKPLKARLPTVTLHGVVYPVHKQTMLTKFTDHFVRDWNETETAVLHCEPVPLVIVKGSLPR